MSLDTYENLKLEIADYLNRKELADNISTFIQLAESKINRDLRLREQEQLSYTEYNTTATSPFIAVPSKYIEFLTLKIKLTSESDDNYEPLQYLEPARIQEEYRASGEPEYYTLRNQLELNCLPANNYTLRMHYIKSWDIASDLTNWLLTNHPDVYLFGALANAMPFLKNDKRIPTWTAAWTEAMAALNEVAERGRDMGELDTSGYATDRYYGRYNVLTGNYR